MDSCGTLHIPDGNTGDGKKYKWVGMIQTTSHVENVHYLLSGVYLNRTNRG